MSIEREVKTAMAQIKQKRGPYKKCTNEDSPQQATGYQKENCIKIQNYVIYITKEQKIS